MVLIGSDVNYNDVPDKIVPVPPGTYTCLIQNEPEFMKTKDGTKDKVVVVMKIDCPETPLAHGKLLWDHIVMDSQTRLKRVFMAAGVPIGTRGLDLADLINATLEVRVTADVWKKDDGTVEDVSRIGDYLVTA